MATTGLILSALKQVYLLTATWTQKVSQVMRATLKETSTLKANGYLIVENTVLFQISVESSAMRYQCQAKQGLPVTYFYF